MNTQKPLWQKVVLWVILALAVGCRTPAPTPAPPSSTATSVPTAPPAGETGSQNLTADEIATLSSLEQVDNYPLYTMRYFGAYASAQIGPSPDADVTATLAWACSLFAALGDANHRLYGRNFDWQFSPALLLFTDPPDGYASVSMVDIAYLGFDGDQSYGLTDRPLDELRSLLDAPFWPFDGMNEHGLAVGMAAVPESEMPPSAGKEAIGSLGIIREMLDHARTVDEAVAILQSYDIRWSGGPALHYLLADTSGKAVLVEFYEGETALIPNESPWHLATNFVRTASQAPDGGCWRYARIHERLQDTSGRFALQVATDTLEQVSQPGTQWSIVYDMSTGQVNVAMGRRYEQVHTFSLSLTPEGN